MSRTELAGPLLQAIAAAQAWLDEANVPAAVVGGVAASLLGRPRVTKDVDLVAVADDRDWPELLSRAQKHEIRPRIKDAIEFARTSRVLLLEHAPSRTEIDLSFAGLPFERELVERSTLRSVKGVEFRLSTPEDILVMKALALRPRDVADIEAILELYPDVDLSRVRTLLAAFTEALEGDDFAGEFERILTRVKRRR